MSATPRSPTATQVSIPVGDATLEGDLVLPGAASGIVVFAHGSGSSRHSPRNRRVAATLNQAGLGTLLLDLLTPAEEQRDLVTAESRFDIDLLARRGQWTRPRQSRRGSSEPRASSRAPRP